MVFSRASDYFIYCTSFNYNFSGFLGYDRLRNDKMIPFSSPRTKMKCNRRPCPLRKLPFSLRHRFFTGAKVCVIRMDVPYNKTGSGRDALHVAIAFDVQQVCSWLRKYSCLLGVIIFKWNVLPVRASSRLQIRSWTKLQVYVWLWLQRQHFAVDRFLTNISPKGKRK